MPASVTRVSEPRQPGRSPVTSGCSGPNINPATGFSTDYLNHFTEAVMILEMAADVPECLEDLRAWRPMTYIQHFAASRFSNREAIIDAYHAADSTQRRELEQTAAALNTALIESRDAVIAHRDDIEDVTQRALQRVRPLIARTAAVLIGTPIDDTVSGGQQQAAIDAMFGA